MKRFRLFVSSVQKELQNERYAIRDYIHGDPLLRRYFDVFLFEDLPASDHRAYNVYLEAVLAGYNLNDRQRKVIRFLKIHGKITNSKYQEDFSVAKRTASLDLSNLVTSGLVEKIGSTGKGVHYRLTKGASKGQKGQ